jgi:hypothetical protein
LDIDMTTSDDRDRPRDEADNGVVQIAAAAMTRAKAWLRQAAPCRRLCVSKPRARPMGGHLRLTGRRASGPRLEAIMKLGAIVRLGAIMKLGAIIRLGLIPGGVYAIAGTRRARE